MSQSRQRSGRTTPTALPAPNAQVVQFLDEFDAFLAAARGLAGGTRRKYGRFVRHFLHEWTSGDQLEWQNLSAASRTASPSVADCFSALSTTSTPRVLSGHRPSLVDILREAKPDCGRNAHY
jgi:hypothetical protein